MSDAMMWIHMEFPTSFLRNFTSHGDVLMQFLVALQTRGIRIGETESMRTRIRGGRAGVSWEGTAYGPVHEIMPGMVKELTGEGQDG